MENPLFSSSSHISIENKFLLPFQIEQMNHEIKFQPITKWNRNLCLQIRTEIQLHITQCTHISKCFPKKNFFAMNQIYFIDVYNLSTNDILKIYYVVPYNKIYYYMFDIGARCFCKLITKIYFFSSVFLLHSIIKIICCTYL